MFKDNVITNPRIHLSISLVMVPMIVIFFKPSLQSFLGFFFVDFVSYIIFRRWEIPVFHRIFPRSRLFFPALNSEIFAIKTLEHRLEIYNEMSQFPQRRALFIGLVSSLKVLPSFTFGLWAWHDQNSISMILLKGSGICAFSFSYAIGMAFLGYHNQVTEFLHEIHSKNNWFEVFKSIKLGANQNVFQRFEVLCAAGVLFFWLGMILVILYQNNGSHLTNLAQVIYLSIFGIYFIAQLYSTSRQQLTQGIDSLVAYHSNSPNRINPNGLPLSTNPTLAWYQKTFNDMIERNLASEQEIHRFILHQAEDSRYLQLGHVTGLLIHDLATPLTVMRHCVTEMVEENQQVEPSNNYLTRLNFCINQMSEFTTKLRSSLREKAKSNQQGFPHVAHEAACQMASYLHPAVDFNRISLRSLVNPQRKIHFPQPELNQIFLNLYSNAIANLLENKVENPSIILEEVADDLEFVSFAIRDNGTGLSLQSFHYITEQSERLPGKEGIGLKLTKRLVELYGGSLSLHQSSEIRGTEFILQLKKLAEDSLSRSKLSDEASARVKDSEIQLVESAQRPKAKSQES